MISQKRYNVFNNIHKALRSMLFNVQMKMQQTDFCTPEANSMITELEKVLHYYDEHADHEDKYLLANIEQREPQITAELEKDHVVDHELSDNLRNQINRWKEGKDASERQDAAQEIFYALNDFVAFNLYHMNKEERQLLPLLWKHYTDMEIIGMEQQIIASINPQTLMDESRWMMRSISNHEIREWLGGVKMGAPEPVYHAFVQMAHEELPANRFAALQLN